MARILVVDDDVSVADLLAYVLETEGYEASAVPTAQAALELLGQERFDLVVLDVRLPDMPGDEMLARLRQLSAVPVLMLSATTAEDTIVEALRVGADDYVTKPFRPRQLLARIHALLRRAGAAQGAPETAQLLSVGPITLDLDRLEATIGGQPIDLSPIQFRVLHYLVLNAGRIMTFEQIIRQVWGFPGEGNETLLRVHISRIRRKLQVHPGAAERLVNRAGVGYGLFADAPAEPASEELSHTESPVGAEDQTGESDGGSTPSGA
jgi:DNA-binding response OmpR family regulator